VRARARFEGEEGRASRDLTPPTADLNMSLTSGIRPGPYEIQSPLGAGGPTSVRARTCTATFGASADAVTRLRHNTALADGASAPW
jgi:hypothetical protein